ncbi:helix-turn-helix domain-containing protein [Gordonibacter sp. 28C]|uniref:helix-turn-helix domain-containing protein n=1 Tax=Gordonibacter sp. 28C TaxID=2078569 RepID=UPI0021077CD3|nr:helix-turn-helix transcriptional regulator [Gordonibacter sp. 28C]
MQFGLRMKELRDERGWSQRKLSSVCGLSHSYIGDCETGRRNISLDNIKKIANSFDMTVGEFMKDID